MRQLADMMRQLLRSSGARAAAQNVGWLMVEKLVRLLFNVVVGFAVARYLGPAEFGRLSYAFAVIGIGVAVAEGGVAAIVRREVAGSTERAMSTLAAAWRLRLVTGLLCYAAVALWSLFGEQGAVERTLLLVAGLLLFQPALAVADLWLQARLQARVATRAQLAALIVGAALRLALIFARAPVTAFAAAAIVEAIVAVMLLNRFARADGWSMAQPAMNVSVRRLWQESWPMLVSGLTVMIYIRIDLIMVRHLVDETAAGAYAAAVRLSELWFFLPGAVVSSLLPHLLGARAAGPEAYRRALQRAMDVNAAIGYVLAVPTVLLAPWIIRLAYGPAFAAAVPVLIVHGWTLIWAALGVVRGQFCVNEGLTRLHLFATTAGAILNVALNWLLIPRYGAVGAAWATLAAQAVAAWLSSFFFASTRECAALQTRALLIPLRCFEYARSRQ